MICLAEMETNMSQAASPRFSGRQLKLYVKRKSTNGNLRPDRQTSGTGCWPYCTLKLTICPFASWCFLIDPTGSSSA